MNTTPRTPAPIRTLPDFPHNVVTSLTHVEGGEQWGAPVLWRDYLASRVHGETHRPIAEFAVYPDGRVYARRHHAARGVLDARAWAGIVATLDADPSSIQTGVIMAGNPA